MFIFYNYYIYIKNIILFYRYILPRAQILYPTMQSAEFGFFKYLKNCKQYQPWSQMDVNNDNRLCLAGILSLFSFLSLSLRTQDEISVQKVKSVNNVRLTHTRLTSRTGYRESEDQNHGKNTVQKQTQSLLVPKTTRTLKDFIEST